MTTHSLTYINHCTHTCTHITYTHTSTYTHITYRHTPPHTHKHYISHTYTHLHTHPHHIQTHTSHTDSYFTYTRTYTHTHITYTDDIPTPILTSHLSLHIPVFSHSSLSYFTGTFRFFSKLKRRVL